MSITIRGAHGCDVPHLYSICLKTGNAGADAEALYSDPWLLGQYYAGPYFFFQRELCFVAEEGGVPAGYILGVGDTLGFNAWLEAEWLPPLRRRYPPDFPVRTPQERAMVDKLWLPPRNPDSAASPWLERYPAHLHIDLLPSLQGKGCGRTLMERFMSTLRDLRVPGVHLGVSHRNEKALAFYRKLGFEAIQEESWGLFLVAPTGVEPGGA